MKTKKIEFTSKRDNHNAGGITLRVPANGELSIGQVAKLHRHFCSAEGCLCHGPNLILPRIVEHDDGSAYIVGYGK